ncbi:MAG: hypothetical protein DRJ67_04105 [Thermoprotei archaeon]|nr:MAG: hypothetical protein DRJ67_04105 [Thermoprotei archaeon]
MEGRDEICEWLRREYDLVYFKTREEAVMRILSVVLGVLEKLAVKASLDDLYLEDIAYAELLLKYAKECLER